jgi:hypothetical protein
MPRNFSIKEGDRCPYCKVRFDYKEDAFGKKTYSDMHKARTNLSIGFGIFAACVVVIGIVIGVIVKAVRD